jgi:hypothetical protein
MKKIDSKENEIRGSWIIVGSSIEADQNCKRIEFLKENYLVQMSVSIDGWETLYKDPTDNRLWELSYPESELNGGGSPLLRIISIEDASKKFKF